MRFYPLTLLITLAIVLLSVLPIPEVPQLADVPLVDKWAHFIMYGGWSFVCWTEMSLHECRRARRFLWGTLLLFGLACSALLGGLLELVQAYCTTCRSGDFWDFAADAIGALLGSLLGGTLRVFILRLKFKGEE